MTENDTRWTRRNLIALWDGQPYSCTEERTVNMAECDRIMIAFYRFQTDGKVAYRRLLGMHGGGGGTSCDIFRKILSEKVDKDILSHSGYGGEYPDGGVWPLPVPNAAPSMKVDKNNPNRCFTYSFCWHAQPEFLLWHRPIMLEFERGLQDHDPKYGPDDEMRHNSPDAVAAPYWSWEGWGGLTLPQVLSNPIYVLKTDQWRHQGYPKGSIFPNPYHRWFAPVSLECQQKEYFPTTLSDSNTTTRAAAFADFGAEFGYVWEQVSLPHKPSMKDVVQVAIQNPSWLEFCTMKPMVGGAAWSIENAHNKFHNHVGGMTKGGIQGSGAQRLTKDLAKDPTYYTGTMAQNQSIFDPIFFLHHSNVERQLYSWQRRFANKGTQLKPESIPSEELMGRVLYPWTKPELLYQGKLSWNTPSSDETDGSFRDWWPHDTLPYKYDDYLDFPEVPFYGNIPYPPSKREDAIRMKIYIEKRCYLGGEYELYFIPKSTCKKELVGAISILSGVGGVCAQCSLGVEGCVAFEVSDTFKTISIAEKAFENGELNFTRNDLEIEMKRIELEPWCSHSPQRKPPRIEK